MLGFVGKYNVTEANKSLSLMLSATLKDVYKGRVESEDGVKLLLTNSKLSRGNWVQLCARYDARAKY